MMIHLVPKVFFNHLSESLDQFVNRLGLTVVYQDDTSPSSGGMGQGVCGAEPGVRRYGDRPAG